MNASAMTLTDVSTVQRTDKVIDGLYAENVFVLGERQRRTKGRFGIVRFELPLSENVEMIGFGRSPDVVDQLSIGHTAGACRLLGEKPLKCFGCLGIDRIQSFCSMSSRRADSPKWLQSIVSPCALLSSSPCGTSRSADRKSVV